MLKAVLDSNVIWGALSRDVLLWLAFREEFEPKWCNRIISALERHLLPSLRAKQFSKLRKEYSQKSDDVLMRQADAHATERIIGRVIPNIKASFPHAMVSNDEIEANIHKCHNDWGDRHVLASAIASGAGIIVTENLKHFKKHDLDPHNVVAMDLDDFLFNYIDSEALLDVIKHLSNIYKKPKKEPVDIIRALKELHNCHKTAKTLLTLL